MITDNYPQNKPFNYSPAPIGGGASDVALGNIASIASKNKKSRSDKPQTMSKWKLQNYAAELLPNEKVAQCKRHRAPVNHKKDSPVYATVEVHKHGDKCHYENLIVCDRVWTCPVCSSRISEIRRKTLTLAIGKTEYKTLLATFTLSHQQTDSLDMLLSALTGAYRKLKEGRLWQNFKSEFGWIGDVSAKEITYGDNGWHPHIHTLMLFPADTDEVTIGQIEQRLKKRWLEVLAREGMTANWEHGCDVRAGSHDIRDYIAKFGRLPEQPEQKKSGWTIEHELTKGTTKQGRRGGRSPWELLRDYGEGDDQAGALFVEYSRATKGRNQLVWSRGLKDLLNIDAIEEEITEESQTPDEDTLILEIYPVEWKRITYHKVRGEVLRLAEEKPIHEVWEFIYNLERPPE